MAIGGYRSQWKAKEGNLRIWKGKGAKGLSSRVGRGAGRHATSNQQGPSIEDGARRRGGGRTQTVGETHTHTASGAQLPKPGPKGGGRGWGERGKVTLKDRHDARQHLATGPGRGRQGKGRQDTRGRDKFHSHWGQEGEGAKIVTMC